MVQALDQGVRRQCGPDGSALELQAEHRLEQRVTPAQVLFGELLSLPHVELEQRIAAELDANPALELTAPPSCPGCGSALWRGFCVRCEAGIGRVRETGEDPAHRDDVAERIVARVSPRERLLAAAAAALTPAQRIVAAHLLADTDDLGVLVEPATEIAARLGIPATALREIIAVLRDVSGRAGLCAASLPDRLRLEVLQVAEHTRVPTSVTQLISGRFDQLTRAPARPTPDSAPGHPADLTADELAGALTWLRRHLTAEVFEPDQDLPATPAQIDIVIRHTAGELAALVVPGPWSAVQVAESYQVATAGVTVTAAVTAQLARAREVVGALARREQVLLRVAEATARRQAGRVVRGPAAHQPLTRRQIAAELAMHEATVSRVVAGKHALLPTGEIVPLAALFGAARGAQECLREAIRRESSPLSDAALVEALATSGYHLARRTVAKYRAALGIPDYRHR